MNQSDVLSRRPYTTLINKARSGALSGCPLLNPTDLLLFLFLVGGGGSAPDGASALGVLFSLDSLVRPVFQFNLKLFLQASA